MNCGAMLIDVDGFEYECDRQEHTPKGNDERTWHRAYAKFRRDSDRTYVPVKVQWGTPRPDPAPEDTETEALAAKHELWRLHGYTCGWCEWGRADQPRSKADYDAHVAETGHVGEPPLGRCQTCGRTFDDPAGLVCSDAFHWRPAPEDTETEGEAQ